VGWNRLGFLSVGLSRLIPAFFDRVERFASGEHFDEISNSLRPSFWALGVVHAIDHGKAVGSIEYLEKILGRLVLFKRPA
jgi:hypothetical protein